MNHLNFYKSDEDVKADLEWHTLVLVAPPVTLSEHSSLVWQMLKFITRLHTYVYG